MASDQRQRRCYYQQRREVDPAIWRACAGSLIHTPPVNSRVYYFPQGHMEQSSSPVSLSPMVTSKPYVLCRVVEVAFLADPDTDEVFVKYHLEPLKPPGFLLTGPGSTVNGGDNGFASFAKVLTASDANNGGGFSVPRFCADAIFPPLDMDADPPVQNIRIVDIHGEEWVFRHIYRGTPRRHLLTTGWSKFVNSKKLIAKDSVVFIQKKLTGELFVGIRRYFKMAPPPSSDAVSVWGVKPKPSPNAGGFSRTKRGRVPPEAVVEAAERAASEMPFEVVYYPRPGLSEFVVAAEKVDMACGDYWIPGAQVKLAQETEDGSRLTWYNGKVVSVGPRPDHGPWPGSYWRMLQVAWDESESEILQNMMMVSPWQVELTTKPPNHPAFPPIKKFKGMQDSVLLTGGEGDFRFPVGFSSMRGQLSPSYINYNNFPAGMQGARQNPFFLSTAPNIINEGSHKGCLDDNVDLSQKVEADLIIPAGMQGARQNPFFLSTSPNIINDGSHKGCLDDDVDLSQKVEADLIISCETASPDSHDSVQLFGMAANEHRSCNLTTKGVTSFQLFGKIIHMEQPHSELPLAKTDDISCTVYDDYTTKGTRDTVDDSLSDPCQKLDDSAQSKDNL